MFNETALLTFGTLMDAELLEMVSGQTVSMLVREPAVVQDHVRRWVLDDHYPVLVKCVGKDTTGIIIRGLNTTAMQRIEFFEGIEFTLSPMVVTKADGQHEEVCYFADNHRKIISDQEWVLEEWQRYTKADTMRRVTRYMQCFGVMSAVEADAYW